MSQHTPGPWIADDDLFEEEGNVLRVGTWDETKDYYHLTAKPSASANTTMSRRKASCSFTYSKPKPTLA